MIEIVSALLSGADLAVTALFESLKIYSLVEGFKDVLLASLFGVPMWVIGLISALTVVIKIVVTALRRI